MRSAFDGKRLEKLKLGDHENRSADYFTRAVSSYLNSLIRYLNVIEPRHFCELAHFIEQRGS